MNVNEKLEVFRKVHCLGMSDIVKAFGEQNQHIQDKYSYYREKDGVHGNYSFLMSLDQGNADTLFEYIGFN